jgi:hypothetical protein
MQGARHPANLNQPNEVKPKGTETSAPERGTLGQQGEKLDKAQQKLQETEQGQFHAQVQGVASRLGSFGFVLQERVNQLLTKGATSVGMSDKSMFTVNPSGEYSIQDITESSVDPVVRQKQEEQKRLQEVLSPYTKMVGGKAVAKSFQDVVGEMFSKDPETASYINQAMDTLDNLNKSGKGDSSEARAAMEQLAAMDHTGDISGIFQSKRQYERMMGIPGNETDLKWYGDRGDTGYTALELSQLGADTIKSEVENSLNFSSGLFGGDFESSLQRLFDTESADIRESNRKKEAIRNQMSAGFESFVDEAGGQFADARKKYEDSFTAIGKAIVDDLQKSGKTIEAQMWAEAVQGGNLSGTLYSMLNDPDSGMSADQRKEITKFIGKAGEQTGNQLFSWLNSLQQTGSITVVTKDSQGKDREVQISPDARQQLDILRVMNDPKLTPEQKQAELKTLVKQMAVNPGQTIGSIVQAGIAEATRTNNLDAGLETMKTSLVESLKTFAGSLTENAVRSAMGIDDATWSKMSDEQKQNQVAQTLKDNPGLIEGKASEIFSKAREIKTRYDQSIKTAKDNLTKRNEAIDKEATFDEKGELTGGRLKGLSDTNASFLSNLPGEISRQVVTTLGSGFDLYRKGLGVNPVVAASIASGKIDPKELGDIAMSYSYRDAIKSIQEQSPELYNLILQSAGVAVNASTYTSAIESAIRSGDTSELLGITDRIKAFQQLPPDKLSEIFQRYILQARKLPIPEGPAESQPWQAALRLRIEQADLNRKAIDDGLAKAKAAKAETTTTGATIDNMANKFDGSIFSPDQLMKYALETGKQQELGTAGMTLGVQPEVLQSLKIDPASISQINGVPYVKMGDGKYQPLDEAILTGIITEFNIPVAAQEYGPVRVGVQGPETADIGITAPPVVPETKTTTTTTVDEKPPRERIDKQQTVEEKPKKEINPGMSEQEYKDTFGEEATEQLKVDAEVEDTPIKWGDEKETSDTDETERAVDAEQEADTERTMHREGEEEGLEVAPATPGPVGSPTADSGSLAEFLEKSRAAAAKAAEDKAATDKAATDKAATDKAAEDAKWDAFIKQKEKEADERDAAKAAAKTASDEAFAAAAASGASIRAAEAAAEEAARNSLIASEKKVAEDKEAARIAAASSNTVAVADPYGGNSAVRAIVENAVAAAEAERVAAAEEAARAWRAEEVPDAYVPQVPWGTTAKETDITEEEEDPYRERNTPKNRSSSGGEQSGGRDKSIGGGSRRAEGRNT